MHVKHTNRRFNVDTLRTILCVALVRGISEPVPCCSKARYVFGNCNYILYVCVRVWTVHGSIVGNSETPSQLSLWSWVDIEYIESWGGISWQDKSEDGKLPWRIALGEPSLSQCLSRRKKLRIFSDCSDGKLRADQNRRLQKAMTVLSEKSELVASSVLLMPFACDIYDAFLLLLSLWLATWHPSQGSTLDDCDNAREDRCLLTQDTVLPALATGKNIALPNLPRLGLLLSSGILLFEPQVANILQPHGSTLIQFDTESHEFGCTSRLAQSNCRAVLPRWFDNMLEAQFLPAWINRRPTNQQIFFILEVAQWLMWL